MLRLGRCCRAVGFAFACGGGVRRACPGLAAGSSKLEGLLGLLGLCRCSPASGAAACLGRATTAAFAEGFFFSCLGAVYVALKSPFSKPSMGVRHKEHASLRSMSSVAHSSHASEWPQGLNFVPREASRQIMHCLRLSSMSAWNCCCRASKFIARHVGPHSCVSKNAFMPSNPRSPGPKIRSFDRTLETTCGSVSMSQPLSTAPCRSTTSNLPRLWTNV
mmetsp:Transcript_62506/g.193976  ORF Transcript_62506/g.193976 Transcript_62506/m.193976 type:complete len:219 (+) Transcript_62506:398-1054(+)